MLKRAITYEDFDGNEATDICYFNLSKNELIELELEQDSSFSAYLKRIVETKNNKELLKQFKDLILMAYGKKSDDGKRFEKSDKIREEFSQTAAYQALYVELATKENAAIEFFEGILPKDMQGTLDQDKPANMPSLVPPPTPPT